MQIQFFEPPGIQAPPELVKEIEKHFQRQEFRRAAHDEVGEITYPTRAAETYADDLLRTVDVEAIQARASGSSSITRYSAASLVLPLVLGPLGVETIAAHPYAGEQTAGRPTLPEALGTPSGWSRRSAPTSASSSTAAAERIYLVDEQAHEVPVEQELLLFLACSRSDGKSGTARAPDDRHEPRGAARRRERLEVERTAASLSALTRGRGRRRRRLRRLRRRRLRLPGVPAGLRRRREPLQPARAPRADREALSELVAASRSPLSSTARSAAPGRARARSCASSRSG